MADRDEGLVEAELVDRLKEQELSQYEAHTLVNLTRLGSGTAKDVAGIDDVPRTRVYDAVDTLHERGLVDVQHTTPRKFTVVSRETIVRKFTLDHESTITEIAEPFEELGPTEPRTEQLGVWTVTGRAAVAQRVFEFIDEADEQIVYMTVDELLTEEHLERLGEADERGVDIYVAGVTDAARVRVQDAVPSAEVSETPWEWAETPAGNLLITDEETALVSVCVYGSEAGEIERTAIWAAEHVTAWWWSSERSSPGGLKTANSLTDDT
ncbi:TrmB family transcriptional regulator [Halorarum salinum]|uniref:TrmB family transcriptional regulator n=1 Tax=Halorarum salinum TaxID=2743089 RepID=UPI001FE6443C|nr:helix-turn-helix domain-containing protein [Halobaculum salinum]